MMSGTERGRLQKLLESFLKNRSISPEDTATWLESLEWTEAVNKFGPNFRTFQKCNGNRQIRVPVKDTYDDYSYRLVEMLEEIAEIEQGFTIDHYRQFTTFVVQNWMLSVLKEGA